MSDSYFSLVFFTPNGSSAFINTYPVSNMPNNKEKALGINILALFMLMFFLTVLSVVFCVWPVSAGNTPQERPMRIGVYDDPPSVYIEDGIVKGVSPEIFEKIASDNGLRFEYVHGSWSEIYHGLKNGNLDMLYDIARTKEREGLFDFNNETLMVEWGVVMARKGHKIASPADLVGKAVAGVTDDVYFEGHPDSFKEMMATFGVECRFIESGGFSEAARAVIDGKADACVLAKSFADYNLNRSYLDYTPIIFKPVKIHFAFTKGSDYSKRIIPMIDLSLAAMKADKNSVYYTSHEKYIKSFSIVEKIPRWIWVFAAAFLVLIMFVFTVLHIHILKRQVRQKTSELLMMNQRLEDLSARDPLTRIANRRTFNERLEHEIERAKRYGSDLCLILFDIDFFKSINDRFGHIAGDDVIADVAGIMSLNTRKVDLVARYGGEEFGIILPETNLENAWAIAEKIRSITSSHIKKLGDQNIQITLTGGVASWADHFRGMSDFINAADSALYNGKRSGRNTVIVSRDNGCDYNGLIKISD